MARIRLFIDHPLGAGQPVPLDGDQAHYLSGVMRLAPGDLIEVFNGRDGAWSARLVAASKRGGSLDVLEQVAPQRDPPDLWLLFAPIKKARTDFIVEKAAELGAARIIPVQTDHTNAERIRQDRLQAHAVEAAEQCGILSVPEVVEMQRLDDVVAGWDETRTLLFCDERDDGRGAAEILAPLAGRPLALLVGPEGGFSSAERDMLRAHPSVVPLSLGPRILRADTAAVAALAVLQAVAGDWPR